MDGDTRRKEGGVWDEGKKIGVGLGGNKEEGMTREAAVSL